MNLESKTILSFISEYKKDIRVNVEWGDLLKLEPHVSTEFFYPGKKMCFYHPWSKEPTREGGSIKTKMKMLKYKYDGLGREFLVRLPAVRFNKKILLLDGNHRVSQILPKYIILDIVDLTSRKQARCFSDLYGKGFIT